MRLDPRAALRAHFTKRKKHPLLMAGAFAMLVFMAHPSATAQSLTTVTTESEGPEVSADPVPALLDTGFRNLYELNFKDAREQFLAYQKARPQDPMGVVAEAASHLYEQFNAKGVFTSAFFLDNDKFLNGVDGTPAENENKPFLQANDRARQMARNQLKSNPGDKQALLALTMADGMESNYDALIVKKQLAALSLMKQAEAEATKLLAVDPNAQDAYLALGTSNYVIGCLSGFKRAFLWFGGVHGDRDRGIAQMQRAADHGQYLKPFAKIMLALACEREHQTDRARELLRQLTQEFPSNPIFLHELALLDHHSAVQYKAPAFTG
jgi:tetratricopeptide (TPR) repeat protein